MLQLVGLSTVVMLCLLVIVGTNDATREENLWPNIVLLFCIFCTVLTVPMCFLGMIGLFLHKFPTSPVVFLPIGSVTGP